MTQEEIAAAAAAYEKNIPGAPIAEPLMYNSKQPHLVNEAIMVDLLSKNTVFKTDVPEDLHKEWDAFFALKPQGVGKVRFHEFYNYLFDPMGNEQYKVNKQAIVARSHEIYEAFLRQDQPHLMAGMQLQVDAMRNACRLLNPEFADWVDEGVQQAITEYNERNQHAS